MLTTYTCLLINNKTSTILDEPILVYVDGDTHEHAQCIISCYANTYDLACTTVTPLEPNTKSDPGEMNIISFDDRGRLAAMGKGLETISGRAVDYFECGGCEF